MSLPITGQRVAKAVDVESLPLVAPVVPVSSLVDTSSPINNSALSGKQKGACVLVEMGDGSITMATARGELPGDSWDVSVSTQPVPFTTGIDVFNWTGSQAVAAGTSFDLFSLAGMTKAVNDGIAIKTGSIIKLQPLDGSSLVQFTVRLTGTTSGQTYTEWKVQVLRIDGVTVVASTNGVRGNGATTAINAREQFLSSYTSEKTDPFSVDGLRLFLTIDSGFNSLTLTSVSIRISRMPL